VALTRPGCLEEQVVTARHRHLDTGVLRPTAIRQHAPVQGADLPASIDLEGIECPAFCPEETLDIDRDKVTGLNINTVDAKTETQPCILGYRITVGNTGTGTVSGIRGHGGLIVINRRIKHAEAAADAIKRVVRVVMGKTVGVTHFTAAQ